MNLNYELLLMGDLNNFLLATIFASLIWFVIGVSCFVGDFCGDLKQLLQTAKKKFSLIFNKIINAERHIVNHSGTCLIRHTKGPGKCVALYRMSEPV
jgi:hypothetical protein